MECNFEMQFLIIFKKLNFGQGFSTKIMLKYFVICRLTQFKNGLVGGFVGLAKNTLLCLIIVINLMFVFSL